MGHPGIRHKKLKIKPEHVHQLDSYEMRFHIFLMLLQNLISIFDGLHNKHLAAAAVVVDNKHSLYKLLSAFSIFYFNFLILAG